MGTQPPLHNGVKPPPQFSAHFYCGQTAGCIKMPLGTEVGLSPGDYGLDVDPATPLPKGKRRSGQSPQFSAHGHCGRTAGSIKMALSMEVGLGPVNIVLDGDTASLLKTGGRAPPPAKFLGHLYCCQTARCFKMPLGTEVGLGLRYIVFDVDPATPSWAHPPHLIFGRCLLWPNGWMDEDAVWYVLLIFGRVYLTMLSMLILSTYLLTRLLTRCGHTWRHSSMLVRSRKYDLEGWRTSIVHKEPHLH